MRKLLALFTTIALPFAAACTVHQTEAPSETGPAEVSLSLKLAATPDHLVQDGAQSSQIAITAFDAGGHAIAVQVRLTQNPAGFGTLSADNLATTTDASRPTTVTYIPPASTSGSGATVTIFATMVGPNSVTNSTQQVQLQVLPAATVSAAAPAAVIVLNPATASSTYLPGQNITFDGTASCGNALIGGVCSGVSTITKYSWTFGDGASAAGSTAVHSYAAGTFTATLTVNNDRGLSSTTTRTITAATVAAPTASFLFSPTTIHKDVDTVQFNAGASRAASGHSIVQYDWNFGDGSTATTTQALATHTYTSGTSGIATTANTYVVQLTVTDDVGQRSTSVTQNITVLP